jgi:hypothetical protein
MKSILRILPICKEEGHQIYEVLYTENFVNRVFEGREKKIVKEFGIDKGTFKRLLLDSIDSELG